MKNLKTVVSALAVVGLGAVAFAGEATKADAAKPAKSAEKAATMKTWTVTGKLASISSDTKSLKVTETAKGPDGKEMTKEVEIWWSDTTKLMWKNEKKTAATNADLKAGAEVTIKAEANAEGKPVATEIWFHPEKAAMAAPASKTEDKKPATEKK